MCAYSFHELFTRMDASVCRLSDKRLAPAARFEAMQSVLTDLDTCRTNTQLLSPYRSLIRQAASLSRYPYWYLSFTILSNLQTIHQESESPETKLCAAEDIHSGISSCFHDSGLSVFTSAIRKADNLLGYEETDVVRFALLLRRLRPPAPVIDLLFTLSFDPPSSVSLLWDYGFVLPEFARLMLVKYPAVCDTNSRKG